MGVSSKLLQGSDVPGLGVHCGLVPGIRTLGLWSGSELGLSGVSSVKTRCNLNGSSGESKVDDDRIPFTVKVENLCKKRTSYCIPEGFVSIFFEVILLSKRVLVFS